MEYLVCYDIVEDDIRKDISDICLNKGLSRIQYSVFFGELTKNRAEEVLIEIKDAIKGNEAIIVMIEVCEKCSKKKKIVVEHKKKEVKEEKEELENLKKERIKEGQESREKVSDKGNTESKEKNEKIIEKVERKKRKKTRITEEDLKTIEKKGVMVL